MNGTVTYITLGCKLNFAETSTYAREFAKKGFNPATPGERPDIYIINSCSVTEHADKKCRNLIRKYHKTNPDAVIAVTGCYAQLQPQEILGIDGVDVVAGAQYKPGFVELVLEQLSKRRKTSYGSPLSEINSIFPAYSTGERTRSFLKVQDGCSYFCSYCTVPIARGASRNIPIATIVHQAEEIAASGVKEIVLTGVNIGDYGRTTGESFLDLIKALNDVEGIERYRISSIEPNLLTDEIISWIASGTKFLPHFHIPVQSGCNKTLKAMHRRYTAEMFEQKIATIRDAMEPDEERFTRVFFGIDVIVGFPGETEEDFEETYQLLERIRPAFLHIFPYSRRAGTEAAARTDQVQDSVKSEREARLQALSDRLHKEFCEANVGRTRPVLFESKCKNGMMAGYTDNYIHIERQFDSSIVGQVVDIQLDTQDSYSSNKDV